MELGVWGKKVSEVKCLSHQIISRMCALNMTYTGSINLTEEVFGRFLHCKVSPLPFRQSTLGKLITKHSLPSRCMFEEGVST